MVVVLRRRLATASKARRKLAFAWVLFLKGPMALRAMAASTVPAQVRKSLVDPSEPAISRK
jgi:hypothetical protein